MFRIHDVFQPPEITDITEDTDVIESFVLLKSHINKEQVPLEALDQAKVHLPAVEVLLVEYYIDKIRSEFYQGFDTNQFAKSSNLLEFFTTMDTAWRKIPLDLFTDPAVAQIKSAWSALVRSVIDSNLFDKMILEYLEIHPAGSPQGTHIITLLCDLGLGPETWKSVAKVVPDEITNWVKSNLTGSWTISVTQSAEKWLYTEYIPRLAVATTISENLKTQLSRICMNALADIRIKEIFHMVLNFPESRPGLEDLKLCLTSPESRAALVREFEAESTNQLLNNGVTTVDIFLGYLKYINAFSVLDPRGVLLDKVSKPIREYLKNRPDSVNLLVDGLMGQEGSPLAFLSDELKSSHRSTFVSRDDLANPNWVPDPVNTPDDFIKRQISDTISTLLSIFDNKDIVSLQLTEDFARRLLLTQSTDELDVLCIKAEDLKRLFSSRQLQNIDVMIRDIRNSNDTSQQIHRAAPELASVKGLIISRLYWPSLLGDSTVKLPTGIEGLLDQYKEAYYSHSQGTKHVTWIPRLGRVSVSVSLADRTVDLVVTPDQAVVLGMFETQGTLNLASLTTLSGLPEQSVLAAIKFWIDEGVLGSSGESYHVLETQQEQGNEATVQVGTLPQGAGTEETFGEMKDYWTYIQHMLKNVGDLPADRIHQFLVMLVPNGKPYVKTLQELESFLHTMVTEEELKFDDGKFSLY